MHISEKSPNNRRHSDVLSVSPRLHYKGARAAGVRVHGKGSEAPQGLR